MYFECACLQINLASHTRTLYDRKLVPGSFKVIDSVCYGSTFDIQLGYTDSISLQQIHRYNNVCMTCTLRCHINWTVQQQYISRGMDLILTKGFIILVCKFSLVHFGFRHNCIYQQRPYTRRHILPAIKRAPIWCLSACLYFKKARRQNSCVYNIII